MNTHFACLLLDRLQQTGSVRPSKAPVWRAFTGFSAVDSVLELACRSRKLISADGPALSLVQSEALSGAEAFRLKITNNEIRLFAHGEAGWQQGLNLLWRFSLLGCLPAEITIETAPRLAWRGLMLDLARRWWPPELIEDVTKQVALFGGNRLHLHLTDDQGWRLPMTGCSDTSGQRPQTGQPGHACYTRQELARLVSHARALGVEIMPEVDLPGHSMALLALRRELSCDGKARQLPFAWGGYPSPFCLGNEELPAFIDELLDSLVSLFPFDVIHLGGDEVRTESWDGCPRCARLAARVGLGSSRELQCWWTPWITARLEQAGRRAAFWDEARSFGAPADALLFAWRGDEAVRQSIADGFETIACPLRPCYLDHYPTEVSAQRRAIMGLNRAQDIAAWRPFATGAAGGQANLWSEYLASTDLLMERLQPRLAMALEMLWDDRQTVPAGLDDLHRTLCRASAWKAQERAVVIQGRTLAPVDRPLHVHVSCPSLANELSVESSTLALSKWQGAGERDLHIPSPGHPGLHILDLKTFAGDRQLSQIQLRLGWMKALPAVAECSERQFLLKAAGPDWRQVRSRELNLKQLPRDTDCFLDLIAQQAGEDVWSETEADAVPTPELPRISPWPEPYGLRLDRSIDLPIGGSIVFELCSMGLARLHVDGQLLIDHDGFQPADRSSAEILLEKGKHQIRLEWLRFRREAGVSLRWMGPGVKGRIELPGG